MKKGRMYHKIQNKKSQKLDRGKQIKILWFALIKYGSKNAVWN
jgi:hypothetical protein